MERQARELVVERSEFHHNRVASTYKDGDPVGHQIYVGSIGRFTLIDSYVHAGAHGHLVRAAPERTGLSTIGSPTRPERRATSWSSRTAASLLCWGTSSSKVRTAKTRDIVSYGAEKATLGRETSCIW